VKSSLKAMSGTFAVLKNLMPEVMGKVTGPVCQVRDDSIPQGLLESMPPHIHEVAEE
jgi:hypothetical protein